MLKDLKVRWLIAKNNPLRGKEPLLIIKGKYGCVEHGSVSDILDRLDNALLAL